MFHPLSYWLAEGHPPYIGHNEQLLGHTLYAKKLRRAREIAEAGCVRLSPFVVIFNDAPKPDSRISDVAEAMRDHDPAVKLVVGFFYTVRAGEMVLEFHLRSSPGAYVNAREIAVANGGGGHDHAAGFILRVVKNNEDEPFAPYVDRSPIEIFKSALASTCL